jgi:hypothetical protein
MKTKENWKGAFKKILNLIPNEREKALALMHERRVFK